MQISTHFDAVECLVGVLELVGADKLGDFLKWLLKIQQAESSEDKVDAANEVLSLLLKEDEHTTVKQHDELITLVKGMRGETTIQEELSQTYKNHNGSLKRALMIAQILDCFEQEEVE